GAEVVSRVTVLADGVQGMLTEAARRHFAIESENPQVYALGVKEVWRVARPLDRVIHTLGWPLRAGKRYREFGGSFIYPMGADRLWLGLVGGLDAADATTSVHDLLQLFKTHPFVRDLLDGGERVGWGAKAIPEGGFYSLPERFSMPGGLIAGDAAGFVNVPKLKGVHYALRSGILAAEAIYEVLRDPDGDPSGADAFWHYDTHLRQSEIFDDLYRVRNMRQAFSRGLVTGGALAGMMDVSRG